MTTLRVDYENNATTWWDAARDLANSMANPTFTRILNALEREDEIGDDVLRGELDSFIAAASVLPGWADGPAYARHPVLW